MTRTIPKKKKCKKTKWLSEDALHIAEKRREVKGKGEMERYTQLNAEYQRIARRDKKAFFFKFNLILFLITLQYCIGFAIHQHEFASGVHVFLNPPP